MRLAELQRAFQAHVVGGAPAAPPAGPRAARGYRVYAHAYRATLLGALRDTFARTAAWMGEAAFGSAAEAYVAATPATGWTLADYGDGFAAGLHAAYPDDPDIAELAWLEWSLRRAFSAPDAAPASADALAAADWERDRLQLHPALAARLVLSDVASIWRAVGEGTAPAGVLLPVTAGLIVWRENLQPRFRLAGASEAAALAELINCGSFAQAASLARDVDTAAAWFAGWLRDGLVAGIA